MVLAKKIIAKNSQSAFQLLFKNITPQPGGDPMQPGTWRVSRNWGGVSCQNDQVVTAKLTNFYLFNAENVTKTAISFVTFVTFDTP